MVYRAFRDLFGDYTPIYDYVYDAEQKVVDVIVSTDWGYVGSVVLFAIVLISFFKIVGAVAKR